jgi:uncharacterized RmlC-like cupin family protein
MTGPATPPALASVVLDTEDARALAEFYRELLGLHYRPGDEPPAPGEPDPRGADWLVLRQPGGTSLAFQQVAQLRRASWPEGEHPQQLHLDLTVASTQELDAHHQRATALGATLLLDRSDDQEEPLRVYADPAGHPFCIFVSAPRQAAAEPVRKVAAGTLTPGHPTPGMTREAAVVLDDVWSGRALTAPGGTSGWHHHGAHDSVVYVVRGAFRVETGDGVVLAGPGDFVHVPAHTVHRESNPGPDTAEVVLVRRGTGPVVVAADAPP